nr:hypothetical protein GCM10020241_09720 [Streptoalloteichus tenebrarius]
MRMRSHSEMTVGAISFMGDDPDRPGDEHAGAWVTTTDQPVRDAPVLYLDKHVPVVFPADAVLPLDVVRRAVHEFRKTGERPRCVRWQESDVF